MTQQSKTHRIRAGLLFAAAALPFSPLAAQETLSPSQTGVQPVIDISPPPATQTAPPPAVTATPLPSTTAPQLEANTAKTEADVVKAPPARTTARAATRSIAAERLAQARASAADQAPARAEPAPPSAVDALPPAEPVPGLVPEAVTPLDETAPQEAPPETINSSEAWPWVVGGLLLVGALALLVALRRRRRMDEYSHDEIYEEAPGPVPVTLEPVTASAVPGAAAVEAATLVRRVERNRADPDLPAAGGNPSPIAAEVPGAPLAVAPVAAAALARGGRAKLELKVRPVRAGVEGGNASVDFDLQILNAGSGPARDLTISSWMYAAGDGAPSEAERRLIEHPAGHRIEEIGQGESQRLRSNARIAVSGIESDSILPVIVVDIVYRYGEDLEGRASASFAVGVPLDGDLAHFDLENPSGLHEGVEARPLNNLQRA